MEIVIGDAEARKAHDELLGCLAGNGNARNVALDVGEEDGNARIAHGLGDGLQGDRLAGAGGAGDEAVAVG